MSLLPIELNYCLHFLYQSLFKNTVVYTEA